MPQAERVGEELDAGRRALLEYDWESARVAFLRADAAGGGAQALEGLAQAAFFLNDPAVAIDAHERAYAAYREADRPVDAARVAIALAWDYRAYRGERAVSDGWLARARRLLAERPPTRESGWLALPEAAFALPEDPARARGRSAEAEALGRTLKDLDLELTAAAPGGLALVSEGDVAQLRRVCPELRQVGLLSADLRSDQRARDLEPSR